MSLHKAMADCEWINEGLRLHHLAVDTPSQPSDCFRSGALYAAAKVDAWQVRNDARFDDAIAAISKKINEDSEWDDSAWNQAIESCLFTLRALKSSPVAAIPPEGYVLVLVEPTEDMIIAGFESVPDRNFDGDDYPEEYDQMSGCQQAAFRAKRCYSAMIAARPKEKP